MKKKFEIPTIEKYAFKLSDKTMCDNIISQGVTNDAYGVNAPALMTENQMDSATK